MVSFRKNEMMKQGRHWGVATFWLTSCCLSRIYKVNELMIDGSRRVAISAHLDCSELETLTRSECFTLCFQVCRWACIMHSGSNQSHAPPHPPLSSKSLFLVFFKKWHGDVRKDNLKASKWVADKKKIHTNEWNHVGWSKVRMPNFIAEINMFKPWTNGLS